THRSPRGLAGAARGMLVQADDDHIIAGLDRIAVPTLVLVGANDTHFLAATDYMARKIPGAVRVTIPDAGHASNLHQPTAFHPPPSTAPWRLSWRVCRPLGDLVPRAPRPPPLSGAQPSQALIHEAV